MNQMSWPDALAIVAICIMTCVIAWIAFKAAQAPRMPPRDPYAEMMKKISRDYEAKRAYKTHVSVQVKKSHTDPDPSAITPLVTPPPKDDR